MSEFVNWLRDNFFRAWTAVAVLVFFGWALVSRPDVLRWWKRSVDRFIETSTDLIPSPWGDRIEVTLGNFGIWVQITLAIIALRVLCGCVAFCWSHRDWLGRS